MKNLGKISLMLIGFNAAKEDKKGDEMSRRK